MSKTGLKNKMEEHNKKSKHKVTMRMLQAVYDRGIGAYKTSYSSVREKGTYKKGTNAPPSKKLSKEQWSRARTFSFVNKLIGNRKLNHDLDLV